MKYKGFTLIELIVVVGIIGILASLSVITLSRQQARSRDARRLGDMTNINTALQSYVAEKIDPPALTETNYTNTAASAGPIAWDMSSTGTFINGLVASGYMQKVPVDPINNATANYWWQGSLNGYTYGYSWGADATHTSNGYFSYNLGTNLELAGDPAITHPNFSKNGRNLSLRVVPVRPAQ